MARRRKPEEHENHERWLVSYADFITLLFAFFVVMYSVSSVNEGKYRVLSDSLAVGFKDSARSLDPVQIGQLTRSPFSDGGNLLSPILGAGGITEDEPPEIAEAPPPEPQPPAGEGPQATGPGGSAPGSQPGEGRDGGSGQFSATMADIGAVAGEVNDSLESLIDQDLVNVRRRDRWLEVEIKSSILFASGSARLESKAISVLTSVSELLKSFPNPIQVEGFTDNVPIQTEAYPSNWELSAARAASVVHLFMKSGVRPDRMVAIGYGEYRPVADNATAEGRNRNRRVVIVVPADAAARKVLELERMSGRGGAGA